MRSLTLPGLWRGALATAIAVLLVCGSAYLAAGDSSIGEGSATEHVHAIAPGGAPEGFFTNLFKVYTPRQACMFYEPSVIWLHFVSDLLIGTAYFSIPVALVYFVRRRKDLAFNWIFGMFAAFILLCGTTHFIGIWDLWQPLYKIDGLVKLATGLVSVATAVALWPLIPKALALPSPAQLELRVQERTSELEQANLALHLEIEARKRAELERESLLERERAARGEAEHANRLKDEFLATLSHELRTPLNAILGWSRLLRSRTGAHELIEGLEVIERNARAQTRLVEDLLDMSRIVSGRLRIDVQPVELADVIDDAIKAVQPAAEAKEIRLQTLLDPYAGPVTGDPARLQQVVWNLLINAVKFTPRGGRVQVFLERASSGLDVTVTDTGDGIAPDLLPYVFDSFRQGDSSSTRRYSGLGLGLALAKRLTELHGGSIRVESPGVGQGATFVVSLPVRDAGLSSVPDEATALRVARRPGEPQLCSLDGVRVLLIEDDCDSREFLRILLESYGAEVVAAGSAAEGFDLLHEHRPDVVLCDIALADEDGFSFLRRVRRLAPGEGGDIPAVAVTAYARSEDQARTLRAGFQRHIAKPFEPAELVEAVGRLTGRLARDVDDGSTADSSH